jgi:outer membrane biogenesis lipoprotein LolB
MHLSFLLSALLILSACSTTPEISSSNENSTAQKIQSNHSVASNAQDEYKKLQAQRDKE